MTAPHSSVQDDLLAIERLLRNWALWRDTARWDDLRAAFAPLARMKTTWFDGAADDFIDASIRAAGKGALVLHSMGASTVEVDASRAVAETRVTLMLRDTLEGVEVDVTCHGCFVGRLVKEGDRWMIQSRIPIYENDCLIPSKPGRAPILDDAVLARFPAGYRHLANLQSRAGANIVMDIPVHNSSQQRALYADAQVWLVADSTIA